jgi:hypothetical protein
MRNLIQGLFIWKISCRMGPTCRAWPSLHGWPTCRQSPSTRLFHSGHCSHAVPSSCCLILVPQRRHISRHPELQQSSRSPLPEHTPAPSHHRWFLGQAIPPPVDEAERRHRLSSTPFGVVAAGHLGSEPPPLHCLDVCCRSR